VQKRHANDNAISTETGTNPAPVLDNSPHAVQHLTPPNSRLPAYPGEEPTISLDAAAARVGISPKRLLGYCFRNGIGDPISDGQHVYPSSLETLKHRLASHASEVQS
jgi:hypothetical protein